MPVNATPTSGAPTFNEVMTANDVYGLIEKVGRQTFGAAAAKNPLSRFDKGFLANGAVLEETLVKAAASRAHVPNSNSYTTPVKPDTIKRYFNNWVKRDYDVSIYREDINAVLSGAMTIGDLASASLESLDVGESVDDYNDLKSTLKQFNDTFARESQKVPAPADLTELVETIRTIADDMSFYNDTYSGVEGCATATPAEKLVVVMPVTIANKIDVRVFAQLFNLSKANIAPEIIKVDTTDGLVYVLDEDAIQEWTKYREFYDNGNGNARTRDYKLAVTKMFLYNPIYKAAVIDASALD